MADGAKEHDDRAARVAAQDEWYAYLKERGLDSVEGELGNPGQPDDGVKAYYALPKDLRWLGDHGNPGEIGGRATDLSMIGGDLDRIITELYKDGITDMVPCEIYDDLQILIAHLRVSERLLGELITAVSEDTARRNRVGRYKLDG